MSERNSGSRSSLYFNYYLIFKNGEIIKLSDIVESNASEILKIDNFLMSKGIKKEFNVVNSYEASGKRITGFEYMRKSQSEEYIKNIETIFKDYNNGNF